MNVFAQMVAQGYRFGAPTQEAEDIDAQVAERLKCRKCCGPMHYEGYYRPGEYVALAVCDHCGVVQAF